MNSTSMPLPSSGSLRALSGSSAATAPLVMLLTSSRSSSFQTVHTRPVAI
jgi:hypothetical protein